MIKVYRFNDGIRNHGWTYDSTDPDLLMEALQIHYQYMFDTYPAFKREIENALKALQCLTDGDTLEIKTPSPESSVLVYWTPVIRQGAGCCILTKKTVIENGKITRIFAGKKQIRYPAP